MAKQKHNRVLIWPFYLAARLSLGYEVGTPAVAVAMKTQQKIKCTSLAADNEKRLFAQRERTM